MTPPLGSDCDRPGLFLFLGPLSIFASGATDVVPVKNSAWRFIESVRKTFTLVLRQKRPTHGGEKRSTGDSTFCRIEKKGRWNFVDRFEERHVWSSGKDFVEKIFYMQSVLTIIYNCCTIVFMILDHYIYANPWFLGITSVWVRCPLCEDFA